MLSILVDTSIWIDYFNKNLFRDQILYLANKNQMATCGLVQTELFPFLRKNRSKTEDFFHEMVYLPFFDEYWAMALDLQDKLISKGYQLGVSDLIIATICKATGNLLFSKDKMFFKTSVITGIKLWNLT